MSNNDGIRAFIALSLPAHVKHLLEQTIKSLKQRVPAGSVGWVSSDLMHLTLFFLGDGIRPDQVVQLSDTLDQIAATEQPFNLTLGKLGSFPDRQKPNIIWIGVDGQLQSLRVIKKRVDREIGDLGWQPEKRRYTPHLTLGRVKRGSIPRPLKLPFGETMAEALWSVNGIHLYRSRLTRQGPVYTKIHSAEFTSSE